jgi:hypothetical protein
MHADPGRNTNNSNKSMEATPTTEPPPAAAVPPEMRELVMKRLNGEPVGPPLVSPAYFVHVTKDFHFAARREPYESGPSEYAQFVAWDIFQGYVIPLLVTVRFFESLDARNAAAVRYDEATALDHEHVRRTVCSCAESDPHLYSPVLISPNPADYSPYVLVFATEMPARQHNVATLAPLCVDDPDWSVKILKSVTSAAQRLADVGLQPMLTPETIFLRNNKLDKVYVAQVVLKEDLPLDEQTLTIDERLARLNDEIAAAAGLAYSLQELQQPPSNSSKGSTVITVDADDDAGETPMVFEAVGNCPVALRELCVTCKQTFQNAGYHLRGADCCAVGLRHFECQSCLNKRIADRLKAAQLDLDWLKCADPTCTGGLLLFDDFGAIVTTLNLREWNRIAREKARKEVEAEVNERLSRLTSGH